MNIIRATEKHIDGILPIWREMMDYHQQFDEAFLMSDDAENDMKQFLLNTIGDEDALVLVALESSNVVGYTVANIESRPRAFKVTRFGYLMDVSVAQTHRRKGIGSSLANEVISWLKSNNISRIELHVVHQNEVGVAFWHSIGFEPYMDKLKFST